MGLAAMGYSTRITFAGQLFPELYGDNLLRATYRMALLGVVSDPKDIDQDAYGLINRYEWRAIRHQQLAK